MKKIYTLTVLTIIILLFSRIGYSQYLMDENFNAMTDGQFVPPTDWVFGQGDFPELTDFEYSSGWKGKNFGNTNGPNAIAIAVNIYGTSRKCWAITPPVDLSLTSIKKLSFDVALTHWNDTNQDYLDNNDDSVFVAYSLDGGFTWDYSQILKVFKGGDIISASGQNEEIDLSSIGSETNVSFAFYAVSKVSNGNDIDFFLDDVKVGGSSDYDMEATSILSPKGVINVSTGSVSAVFTNQGLNPLSGKYFAKILDPNSDEIFSDSVSFSNSLVGQVDTVDFGEASFSINGTYTITATAKASGDLYPSNNNITKSFSITLNANNLVVVYDNSSEQEVENKNAVFNALNSLSIPFDSLDRNSITPNLLPWNDVIWCEEGEIPSQERTAIIDFLNSGTTVSQKTFLIAGDDIGFNHGRAGQPGYDSTFYSYYLHAKYFDDDVSTLFSNYGLVGEDVNNGLRDSIFSDYPDAIGIKFGGVPAYRFASLRAESDTVGGVAFDGSKYNIMYFPFEFREVVSNVTPSCKRLISGSLDWLSNAASLLPVELESFAANVLNKNVSLSWTTATETNNSGFVIERKVKDGSYKEIAFVKGNGTTTSKSSYSFKDKNLNPGSYYYRLKQVDFDGSFELSKEMIAEISTPNSFVLEQNYPNPFNPSTIIKFSIPTDEFVNLSIYNIVGEKVASLLNGKIASGTHEINFNAINLASGTYIYKLQAGSFVSTRKMMVIK